jgi:Helix-turn-helix
MSIARSHSDRTMTQQLLNGDEIDASSYQPSSESVSEIVKPDVWNLSQSNRLHALAAHERDKHDKQAFNEVLRIAYNFSTDVLPLDRTYIGEIERGERNVALVNIEKIARALKLSLSDLFRIV